jgi:yeast amino acid transporter
MIYLRFRRAIEVQNISASALPYRSTVFQPLGSYIAIVFFVFLTLINGFDVFLFEAKGKDFDVSDFFTAYVGIPIFLAIYFGHRLYARNDTWARKPEDVDLVSGMRELLEEERPPEQKNRPWYVSMVTRIWE